ncbi:MAG: hypothetical protein ACXIUB_03530 [Wenzhouxiangella sp.]
MALRVHRALSWLNRAEQCGDADGRFVFLWVAFNAAYAAEVGPERIVEAQRFSNFLNRLVTLDTQSRLAELVWRRYSSAIRVLLDNQYVFQPYWDHQNGLDDNVDWEERFRKANAAAHAAMAQQDIGAVLSIVFARLYTLRNQILHGGATWNSSVNRDQLRDGTAILGDIVPVLVEIMMEHPGQLWGEPCYPVRAARLGRW